MDKDTITIKGENYIKIKHLKTGDQGVTEIVEADDGQQYIHKSIPYVGLPYEQLKSSAIDGVPQVYLVHEYHDDIDEEGQTDIIEEKIDGDSLDIAFESSIVHDEETVKNYVLQLCDILIELHSAGILHRDIKPSNIILDKNGKLWLIDFGSSRIFKNQDEEGKDHDTHIMLTHHYAAPEQYGSRITTPASDIYSLGITMSEMLSSDYNGYLKAILDQCVKKDPEQRYSDAVVLKDAIINSDPKRNELYIAALNGNSISQYELGCFYQKNREYTKAVLWLERAFNQKTLHASYRADAAYKIGYIYEYNLIRSNTVDVWYQKASDLGSNEAYLALSRRAGTVDLDSQTKECSLIVKLKQNPLTLITAVLATVFIGLSGYVLYENFKPISEAAQAKVNESLKIGRELRSKGEFAEAVVKLSEGILADRKNAELLLERGVCYIKRPEAPLDDFVKGLADCEKALLYGEKILTVEQKKDAYTNMAIAKLSLFDYKGLIETADAAITFLDKNNIVNNDYAGLLASRGVAYAKLGNRELALKSYNEALQTLEKVRSKESVDRLIEAGVYHQRSNLYADNFKDYETALKDINKAIEIDPNGPVAFVDRGYIYWKNYKDYQSALRDFNKALKLDPSNIHANSVKSEMLYEIGEFDEKLEPTQDKQPEILANIPSFNKTPQGVHLPSVRNTRTNSDVSALPVKKSTYVFDASKEPKKTITATDKERAERFSKLAFNKLEKKDFDLAIFYFDRAINADYTDFKNYYWRAHVRAMKPNAVKADNLKVIEDCHRFVYYGKDKVDTSTYGDIYYLQGVAHQNLSELAEAVDCFDKAVKNNKKKLAVSDILLRKGTCQRVLKNYDQSLADLDECLKVIGELRQGVDQFNKYVESGAYNQQGIIWADNKQNYDKALECFNKAIEISPEIAMYYCNRGTLYHVRFNDKEKALKDYDSALEIVPNLPNIMTARELLLSQTGSVK